MSLIIVARNLSRDLPEVSDYEVTVLVNQTVIAEGIVRGHVRSQGWQALAARIGQATTIKDKK